MSRNFGSIVKADIKPILMKRAVILAGLLCLALSCESRKSADAPAAPDRIFVHPGILHTAEDLVRIKSLVDNEVEPAYGSYGLLRSDPKASADYEIQGPFEIISRADEYGWTKKPCEDDFNAAYYNALMWTITGEIAHADKAMEIIRKYSAVLRKITPRDDPLCAGLQGFIIVNAAELMRWTYPAESFSGGWTDDDTRSAETMLREAFIPVFTEFHNTPAYTNGNWGLSVLKGMMGMAVFLDDGTMYREAVSRYLEEGYDNGSLPNYTAASGQLQESGRDQAHCMLGLGCMAEICEVAWHQGEDLYSALDNRLMTAYEYLSRYNLGDDDVPFFTWKDKTGKYSGWTRISSKARGQFRSVFEIAYAHYVGRMHLSMPYTAKVLDKIRPEGKGWTCDHPGFGSLLFWRGGKEIYHSGWIDFNKNGRKDIYEDPTAAEQERIRDLLSRMTLDEKTCQMVTLYGTGRVLKDSLPVPGWYNEIWKDGVGNIDEEHNGVHNETSEYAVDFRKHIAALQDIQRWFVEETRLGIPVDFTNEGIRGLCSVGATYFPAQCGQGATWDRELVRRIGEVEAEEAVLLGYTNIYSPILDLAQDPRWGRCVETYGEDPYLVGQLGKEMIAALQKGGVVSTPKHFAVYSIPVGGRDGKTRTDPKVAPREMRTLYLEPFRVAFTEAKALGTMSSYNDYDGVPVSGSRWFLTDLLRKEWGFEGYVVSDSEAVEYLSDKHKVAESYEDAVAQCVNAGLNIRTTFRTPESFVIPLRNAVRDGKISLKTIDERVADILRVKFRLGLFDSPYRGDAEEALRRVHSAENQALSLRAARESMVLLKNDGGLLPLPKSTKRIAVIGPNADEREQLISRYGPGAAPVKTVLEGVRELLPDSRVSYAKGCETVDPHFPESELMDFEKTPEEERLLREAVRTAKAADAVILVLGGSEQTVREERSRTSLDLPGRQQELMERVVATGKPVVLVLLDGRAATVNWADRYVPAILHGWFPGEFCGQAVAETIFGDNNPGGKLSVTFPKSVGQIPFAFPFKPGSDESCATSVWGALYPFGHGLSYTTFEYSELEISPEEQTADGSVSVSCTVTNSGSRAGDEVVQLYLNDEVSSVTTYTKVLRGFERVRLGSGESRRVSFTLTPQDLGLWDKDMRFRVEPGSFEAMVGASSADIRLRGKFIVR